MSISSRTKIDTVRIQQLVSFGYKIGAQAKELLKHPTENGLKNFRKLFEDYVGDIQHDYGVLLSQVEGQIRDDLTRKALAAAGNAVLVSSRGNSTAPSPRLVNILAVTEDAAIRDISVLAGISVASAVAEGTSKGTRGKAVNTTSRTQRLHQKVSTLRRIYFWRKISTIEAEKMIDAILEKAGVTGFKKYNRRKNYVYKEVIFKR